MAIGSGVARPRRWSQATVVMIGLSTFNLAFAQPDTIPEPSQPATSSQPATPSSPPGPSSTLEDSPPLPPPPPPPADRSSNDINETESDERLRKLEEQVAALQAQLDDQKDDVSRLRAFTQESRAEEGRSVARPPDYADGFHFGSYGRVVAAGDLRGRRGRNADIVAHGSRFDEGTYAELELRREDLWEASRARTRVVATLAISEPLFHYNGRFDSVLAVRNLYIEERGLGLEGLSAWAGSRMYRGDDIYVLDWWPLDNLNTLGGGLGYRTRGGTSVKVHGGLQQPDDPFFHQAVDRPPPFGQIGAQEVAILDRQKAVASGRAQHVFGLGETGGLKVIGYGEFHHVRAGQREQELGDFEQAPADLGFVAGGELSIFSGQRSRHLNLWGRYARGLAAFGDLAVPSQLGPDRTSKGAYEVVIALGGNYEIKFFGVLLGAYYRLFRNASPDLDFDDVTEGIVLVRPQFWFGSIAGVALEGSYQALGRGVFDNTGGLDEAKPVFASLGRVGIMPFLSPGGRGSYTRPHIRLMYMLTFRDEGARSLYPDDHMFGRHSLENFIGIGAEWWFGSTSYFRD